MEVRRTVSAVLFDLEVRRTVSVIILDLASLLAARNYSEYRSAQAF